MASSLDKYSDQICAQRKADGCLYPAIAGTIFPSSENRVVHPLAAEVGNGLDECHHERMGIIFARCELRLEQGRDKKLVRGRFDGPAFSLRTACHHRKARLHRRPFELRVYFVVTEVFFLDRFLSVIRRQMRARSQMDLCLYPRKLGTVRNPVGNRA